LDLTDIKDQLATSEAGCSKIRLDLTAVELAAIKTGTLTATELASLEDLRGQLGTAEADLAKQRGQVQEIESQPEPKWTPTETHIKWVSIALVVLWTAYTALVLTGVLAGKHDRVRLDYYSAVAALLPVVLVAALVQALSVRGGLNGWWITGQSAPLVAGETVALYVLATGSANTSMLIQTVSASALAFFWLLGNVMLVKTGSALGNA
jgi:hypothetical protein